MHPEPYPSSDKMRSPPRSSTLKRVKPLVLLEMVEKAGRHLSRDYHWGAKANPEIVTKHPLPIQDCWLQMALSKFPTRECHQCMAIVRLRSTHLSRKPYCYFPSLSQVLIPQRGLQFEEGNANCSNRKWSQDIVTPLLARREIGTR